MDSYIDQWTWNPPNTPAMFSQKEKGRKRLHIIFSFALVIQLFECI